MFRFHRAHRVVRTAISSQLRRTAAGASSSSFQSATPLLNLTVSSSNNNALGAVNAPLAARTLTTSSSTAAASSGTAAPAAAAADDEGRPSAPAGDESQGATDSKTDETAAAAAEEEEKPKNRDNSILDVDPYPPEKIAALEKKYDWVDFNAMARHLHMTDVHFFDQEVPYVDQDFTIRPDFRLLHRLEGANRLKRLQEQEDNKIFRLLSFGYWVTQGRNVRVAREGKIQSLWTMVVAGDQNGTASFGFGKGEDLVIAEKRALQDLRRNLLFVPLFESRTISHEITGKHGVCQVRMWPRPRERGSTAGMIPRMIFECFGIEDITAKVVGRALPHHQALAIFNGLREVKSLREEAIRRGVTSHRMFERATMQPRHPGRQAMFDRGAEVSSMLREVRAMHTHDKMLGDLNVNSELGRKPLFYYPDISESPIDNPNEDNVFVESTMDYIIRKPAPLDLGPHMPGPKFPTSTKPAIKETLFKHRGLPQLRTPQTVKTNKIL